MRAHTVTVSPVQSLRDERFGVLDGLRGIAVMLVVLAHAFVTGLNKISVGPITLDLVPINRAGHIGVELFFFISGFVLFVPYARAALAGTQVPSLAHFIDRRFIKIVPSYYFVLLIVAAVFTLDPLVDGERAWQLFTHLTFTHTFWPDTYSGFVGAFWTLGIEVQFYVLFPLIAKFMRARPFATYGVLLAIGIAYRAWLDVTSQSNYYWAATQLPAQIDLFGTGMLSAYVFLRFGHLVSSYRAQLAATAVTLAAAALGWWLILDLGAASVAGNHHAWRVDHRLIVQFDMAALAVGGMLSFRAVRVAIGNPVLVWISGISYNLYLWHEAILEQCRHTGFPCAGRIDPWTSVTPWNVQYFTAFMTESFLVAAAVTYLLERPLLKMGSRGLYERYVFPWIAKLLGPATPAAIPEPASFGNAQIAPDEQSKVLPTVR